MKSTSVKIRQVLIVEDEPIISQLCSQTLSDEGFEVDIAANGSIAEGMLGEKEYDLIIIDVRMPVMDGKQLYQSIVKRHPDLATGIIFTTGDILDENIERFLKKSGRFILPKPFTLEELKTIVEKALRQIGK
jgi:DNA-binding response OmpR family regulator